MHIGFVAHPVVVHAPHEQQHHQAHSASKREERDCRPEPECVLCIHGLAPSCELRIDLNRSTNIHRAPHRIHVFIAESDTAVRPIETPSHKRHPAKAVLLPVNHDLPTGLHPARFSRRNILSVWVRDVNRTIEGTLDVLCVKNVAAFGSSLVPFLLLVTSRFRSERSSKGSKRPAVSLQVQPRFRFPHDDQVRLLRRDDGRKQQCNQQRPFLLSHVSRPCELAGAEIPKPPRE